MSGRAAGVPRGPCDLGAGRVTPARRGPLGRRGGTAAHVNVAAGARASGRAAVKGRSGPRRAGVGHVTSPGAREPVSMGGAAARRSPYERRGSGGGLDLVDHRRLGDGSDEAQGALGTQTRQRSDLEDLLMQGCPPAAGLGRCES